MGVGGKVWVVRWAMGIREEGGHLIGAFFLMGDDIS